MSPIAFTPQKVGDQGTMPGFGLCVPRSHEITETLEITAPFIAVRPFGFRPQGRAGGKKKRKRLTESNDKYMYSPGAVTWVLERSRTKGCRIQLEFTRQRTAVTRSATKSTTGVLTDLGSV